MQYGKLRTTKITVRSDYPVAIASSQRGANLNAIGFNLDFIARRRPQLASELIRMWQDACWIKEGDPPAIEEDHLAATDDLLGSAVDLRRLGRFHHLDATEPPSSRA